jgi:hypothetical protein
MSFLRIRLAPNALASAFVALKTVAAHAHAVCGNRIFPSTQAIDDPGVTDELTLPSVTWLTAHADEGTWGTTGTIQPGVVYMADKWQIAVEAVIPVNGASGHGAGVVASLDLFLDDIFPNTIGKPIFSQTLPMFTGAR